MLATLVMGRFILETRSTPFYLENQCPDQTPQHLNPGVIETAGLPQTLDLELRDQPTPSSSHGPGLDRIPETEDEGSKRITSRANYNESEVEFPELSPLTYRVWEWTRVLSNLNIVSIAFMESFCKHALY